MKYYIIKKDALYVECILFKNSYKGMSMLNTLLCKNVSIKSDSFINTSYFLTKDKNNALLLKNPNVAHSLANKCNGVIEEVDL